MASIDTRDRPSIGLLGLLPGSQHLVPALIVGFTVLLIIGPLITLLVFSFREGTPWSPGEFSFRNYERAYSSIQTYEIFLNTLILAVAGTAISVVVALFFAFLTERTDMPFRNAAWALMLIPMAMPGLLFAVSWTFLLSPRIGMFNAWLRGILSLFGIDLESGPINIYSGMPSLIFLEGLRGITTAFLIVVAGFRAMDPSLEEAARCSGVSNRKTFFLVTLPLMTPTVFAATMYSFTTSLESLEIPIIIGLPSNTYVFPSYIFFTTQRYIPPQYGLAAALGVSFIILSIILVVWYRYVISRTNRFATITGKGYRPRLIKLHRWRYPAFGLFVLYFMLTVGAPAFALMWSSVMPIPQPPSWEALSDFTMEHYRELLTVPQIGAATYNTIVVAFTVATLTMILSFTLSWVTVRHRTFGSSALDAVAFLPHAVPGVIVGVAFIFMFTTWPLSEMRLLGSLIIIVLAMSVTYIAFGSRTMSGALVQVHKEMEEASSTSGGNWTTTMTRILLPLLLPAFISGWIWVATHALRNFSIPLLLAGRESELLSVTLWHSWDDGYPGRTAALGTLLMIVLVILTVGGRHLVTRLNPQQT